jgi:hypothetical protein
VEGDDTTIAALHSPQLRNTWDEDTGALENDDDDDDEEEEEKGEEEEEEEESKVGVAVSKNNCCAMFQELVDKRCKFRREIRVSWSIWQQRKGHMGDCLFSSCDLMSLQTHVAQTGWAHD